MQRLLLMKGDSVLKRLFKLKGEKSFLSTVIFVLFFSLSLSLFSGNFGYGADCFAEQSGPYVNILDYNAVPNDASFDNIDAIQSAINDVTDPAGANYKKSIYFPAGVYYIAPSGTTRYIVLKSDLHITGEKEAVIKVCDNAGDYDFILRPQTAGTTLNNVSIKNISFDQNAGANTSCNVQTTGQGSRQMILWVGNGSDFLIDHVTCDSCCGVNAFVFNGTNTTNVTVRDSYFKFVRAASTEDYDNSTIYITAKNHMVVNNRFYADVKEHARGAIETHAGVSVVSGNVTEGFQSGVNIVSQSSSATPWAGENDITVTDNTITKANTGINFWSCTGQRLSNVTVAKNTISLVNAEHDRNVSRGIAMTPSADGTLNGTYDNINIADNTITFQAETAAREGLSESSIYGIGIAPYADVKNVNVSGNTITNAPIAGIKVGLNGDCTCTNIVIKENKIINAGCYGFAAVKDYRAAVFLGGRLESVAVENNTISDTNETFSGYLSIQAATDKCKNVSVKNNAVSSKQGGYYFNVSSDVVDTGARFRTYSAADIGTEKMTFNKGDIIIDSGALSTGSFSGRRVTKQGTTGTLSGVTAATTAGEAAITVSDSVGLASGDYITVGGSAVKVLQITGNTVLTNKRFTASATGLAVTYSAPGYKTFTLASE